jgi:tetratricopeptide (TPR) repeat protein
MSLLLPTQTFASARRHGQYAMAALAIAAALGGNAHAQNGPLSLAAPTVPPGGARSADPGMTKAERAANDKRYDEAIQGFDRVLAANPRNAQARFERAWAMAQAGREDDAIRAFSEMAQDFPELPEPHNNLALLYAKRGDLKRAEAELLLATEVKPGFAIGYTNLGDVYRRMAEQAYAEALRRNPGDTRASSALRQLRPAAAATPAPAGGRGTSPANRSAPASAPAAD